ncbi:porin family protein [Solirubrum puertoriconensis]|uniref:Outer membrane protein beta-barrel domain-containing protein n=1 Tax=Solirubrum puertoriconensis TaxID=1751427 RepID=A0A9X0HI70_SOLP1|nr:porin family protein [Solirubrum puertoriconensis]KUG06348.1 hypothetical protein ASU33_03040 [Solirubrum puertoriconensis]
MKKLIFSAATLLAVAASASAQDVKLGLKAGVNLATYSGEDVNNQKYNTGAHAGVAFNFGFSDLLSFQPELLYSMKGAEYEPAGQNIKYKETLHYIDVPLLLKINADGPFFELGPQVGFLAAVNRESTVTSGGVSSTLKDKNKDDFNTVDVGYVAGLGWQFESGPSIGLRYNGSLVPVRKAANGDRSKGFNSTFMLSLGYFFGE